MLFELAQQVCYGEVKKSDTQLWLELKEEYQKAKRKLDEYKELEKQAREKLVAFMQDRGMEEHKDHGLKGLCVRQKGNVDWQKMPEIAKLDADYIDSFRKGDIFKWKFSFY
jgi:hypothetical protein